MNRDSIIRRNQLELAELRRRVSAFPSPTSSDTEGVDTTSTGNETPTQTPGAIINMIRNGDLNHSVDTWWNPPVGSPAYESETKPPTIGSAPTIYLENGAWMILFERPTEFGIEAENAELIWLVDAPSTLTGNIDDVTATIALVDASSFPTSGTVLIGSEVIAYSGKAGNSLTGCARGQENSTAAAHLLGDNVRFVSRRVMLGQVNVWREPQTAPDALVVYRWRNNNRTDIDGWSVWSATATAYGSASATVNDSYLTAAIAFNNDPLDGSLS